MDNLFETTWYEDLLIIAVLMLFLFSIAVAFYGLGATLLAAIGHFAKQGVIFFWCVVLVAFTFILFDWVGTGLLIYALLSPFITISLFHSERRRQTLIQKNKDEHTL